MKKALILTASAACFLALIIYLFNKSLLSVADITTQKANYDSWHTLLNIKYNSYFQWKTADITGLLSSLLHSCFRNKQHADFCVSLTILFSGALTYFYCLSGKLEISKLALSLSLSLCLIYLLQSDSTVIHSLSFSFWLLYFCGRFLKSPAIVSLDSLLLAICLYFIHDSANQLAAPVAAFIFSIAIGTNPGSPAWKKYFLMGIAVVFISASYTAPVPKAPSYPALAHVVPDDNLPGNVMPLIGPYPEIPYINRHALKNFFLMPSSLIFIISLIFWVTLKNKVRHVHYLALLSVCCMLEAFFSDFISVISPIYVINRIVPGLFYIPLLPLFIGGWMVLFSILVAENKKCSWVAASFLAFLLLFADNKSVNSKLLEEFPEIMVSPSYNVIAEAGPSVLARRNSQFSYTKPAFEDFELISASSNSNPKHFAHMFDGRYKSRWSPQLGEQDGSEWINFKFKHSVSLKGVYLDCGNFKSDFPRGLDIEASTNCSDYYSIYQSPVWQGKISYTTEGFPYYENQSEVKVLFEKQVELKCLRIRQTGRSSNFDWSISEFEIIN